MIAHIWMVAAREYRQIAATRSFWITLLFLPLALAMGPIAQRLFDKGDTERVMVIDPTGREGAAIKARIEQDEQRRVLVALSRYAQRHGLDKADPKALWAQHDRIYSNADLAAFAASGGVAATAATMQRAAPAGTPAFEKPEPWYEIVATPPSLAAAAPGGLDRLLEPLLRPKDKDATRPVDYALYVPADFGKGQAPVRLWSKDRPKEGFITLVQSVLTADLRTGFLQGSGLTAAQAEAAQTIVPPIAITTPPPGGGRERVIIRSILPLGVAYILMMALTLSGSWMLQGVVEERSNKLIETVLACISPNELMYGKLVGTVAIGLTMVLVWVLCGVGAAFFTKGAIADVLRPALAALNSPVTITAMLFYFIAGYIMISMIFLALGAMSDSMREAQAYLTPVILGIMMPFILLAQAILQDTGSAAVAVMTWIPIYTPFTMLARLGAGVPVWELLATAVMLVAFITVEMVLLGRVFRASLLALGQKPSLARLRQLIGGREA
ncbi:MAG: ABC transporter permease [Sphingomonas sp.]